MGLPRRPATRAILVLALAGCAGEGVYPPCAEPPPDLAGTERSPLLPEGGFAHLLVVTLDTARRDRVGGDACGGRTPFLDAQMDAGIRLADHRSCANWTYPSMLCALTGHTTEGLGFHPWIEGDAAPPLPDGVTTLARWLRQAGFHTALVSGNPFLSSVTGLDAGYGSTRLDPAPADRLVDAALDRLAALAEEGGRRFLHLHLVDPHAPYDPPPDLLQALDALPAIPWDLGTLAGEEAMAEAWPTLDEQERDAVREHLRVRYDGELRHVDRELARFFASAEAAGLLDDTLVAFWADHGEQFFDQGGFGHGGSLAPAEVRVPAAFWGPGVPTGTWRGPTGHEDLLPTLLRALGRPLPPGLEGRVAGTAPHDRVRHAVSVQAGGEVEVLAVRESALVRWRWDDGAMAWDLARDPAEEAPRLLHEVPGATELLAELLDRAPALARLTGRDPPAPP